eukprot:TRINITY_DN12284_c0_g1_i1.p1 TRINITY_DN12284_c0_g1~~TRINITY_DN12284_c0_g1_i1.p1  ORF type:complete len:537 (-),score=145.46 TRINITY_DN12284_c0_g1_i1:111-1721(-)
MQEGGNDNQSFGEQRAESRMREHKTLGSVEQSRRRNLENVNSIRKNSRAESTAKRRNIRRQEDSDSPRGKSNDFDGDGKGKLKIQELAQLLQSRNQNEVYEALTQFRKYLSAERNPPIREVIQAGVIPRFVQLLSAHDIPNLQFEAAWALTNIASGTADHTRVVIEKGAVPIFVSLLTSHHDEVREQAVWALGNIAGDSPQCRDYVLQNGAMAPLLQNIMESTKVSMLRNATWTLSNFCRGKPQPPFEMVSPALPTLARLIYSTDEEVLTDACWALSYLSDGSNDKIQMVIEAGVCRRMVELLMHSSYAVKTPALRTVGNIVTGDDLQTQIILNVSSLPCLLALLNSPKKGIKKEACWTISNITAGNKNQIQEVIKANIFPPLINLLSNAEFDIKKEAAWAISNATSGGSPEQIKYFVSQGCIKPLCDLLNATDARIITVALEGLENILRVGELSVQSGESNPYCEDIDNAEGVQKIEALQVHQNNEIYEKALKILETYFLVQEQDTSMAPSIGESGNFGFPSGGQGFGGGSGFSL